MKKTVLPVLFLLFSIIAGFTQEKSAEIVDYRIKTEILPNGLYETTTFELIKIFNRKGRRYAEKKIRYRKGGKLKIVSAMILDEYHNKVRKITKKEVEEGEGNYYLFHSDDMWKRVKAYYDNYPYYFQLETKHISSYSSLLFYWFPQDNRNINSLHSSYELIVPKDRKIHYKFYHFTPEEKIGNSKDKRYYFWETGEHLALEKEAASSALFANMIPYAMIVPDTFIFGGTEGSSASWKDLGDWYSRLCDGLDILPDEESKKVRELVKGVEEPKEKIRLIYEYLQENTRYVAIEVGSGNIIPYSAEDVSKNGYGDCKDLSNFMKAMLKTAGINSYLALINGGVYNRIPDTAFVSLKFNHVVLFVPLEKDTLWLENTTQELPFGYWGTHTNGKYALVCDYQKSKLIKTPSFSYRENSTRMTATAEIREDQLLVEMKSVFSGEKFEEITYKIRNKNEKEILEDSQNSRMFPQFNLNNIKYVSEQTKPFSITRELNMELGKHVQRYKDMLIVRPFFSSFSLQQRCPKKKGRKIFIPFNEEVTDSVSFFIPEGYEVLQLPDSSKLESVFGKYSINFQKIGNKILVIRSILQNKGLYPAEDYEKLKKFLKKIKSHERESIVFKQIL